MEKRAFLAVALSLLVLVLYQEWISRQYGTSPQPPAPKQQEEKKAPPSVQTTPAPPPQSKAVEIPRGQPAKGIKDIKVETDNYVALFTNQGARLKSFKFKHYRSSVDEKSTPHEMVSVTPGVPFPLGVKWNGPTASDDSGVVYGVEGSDLRLTGDAKGTLAFRGQTANGVTITKKLSFAASRYPIELEVAATAANGTPIPLDLMLATKSDHAVPNPGAPFEGLLALVDDKIKRVYLEDLTEGVEFTGNISWAGFGQTYFLLALLPDNGSGHRLTAQHFGPAIIMSLGGQSQATDGRYVLFAGPKQLEVLESLGKGLERSIDFGYFAVIAIPFLYILHFSHQFTGSYGIDIIILTVL
ncbi:MAG: membrane protein insertase YidC, partial [Candidatus Binatia bacterium]